MCVFVEDGRGREERKTGDERGRKMEEGRWERKDGRGRMEEGRWKREDGRGMMEEGRWRRGDGRGKMGEQRGWRMGNGGERERGKV